MPTVMQRNKACVSVSVKHVIGALCKLLTAVGLERVPIPETFRRAKFGGGPEADLFWKLLSDILLTANIVSSETHLHLKGEHRELVCAGLWQSGYHANWMFDRNDGREGGEQKAFSSRDLLLALGWLLAAGILEQVVMQRMLKLDRTLVTCRLVSPSFPSELPVDPASLRRLQWLTGSLRHQGRSLLSSLHERTRVLHKDCGRIQQLCDLLEAFVSWKQMEDVFWSWMDSVADCHQTHAAIQRPACLPNQSPRHCLHGTQQLKKLEDVLQKLSSSQQGQIEAQKLRDELCVSFLPPPPPPPLPHSSLPSSSSLSPAYRARFHPQSSGRPTVGPAEGHVLASHAVDQLRHTEAVLMERRRSKRMDNRAELQEISGRNEELVLIPP
ncbi:tubulin epsilon and delta complex protein 1-like isoform X1 [Gouania willdenowi]|uniref:tubulin epsilon and delta complex protein 1-like isoform X1 n=1 Tax=Gouania willdenowi TaxID=441366 RepID=UPI001054D71D|nr:tubulin epsilon and delta complex protein 1-like isoform X1 [Gouania willdenowi]